ASFIIKEGQWQGFLIPDNDHVISTHPYVSLLPENVSFDEYAPWNGYKTYQGTSQGGVVYVGGEVGCYPRKSGPYWTLLVTRGRFNFDNGNPNELVGFVGPNNRAFFRLQGTIVRENEERTWEVRNENSGAKCGQQALASSGNFWLQDDFQTRTMRSTLVSKLGLPTPVTDAITDHGDPRIQLGDVIEIDDPDGFGGSIKLQVLGITRELEDGIGLADSYQVEVVENRGQWILGHPDYSVLGHSTILSL